MLREIGKMLFACLFLTIALVGCQNTFQSSLVQNGNADLSWYDFTTNPTIDLDGKWEFYWKQLYLPGEFPKTNKTFFSVPHTWNRFTVNGKEVGSYGYATYRTFLELPQKKVHLALICKEQATNYRIFVAGKEVLTRGKVGKTHKTAIPNTTLGIADLGFLGGRTEVVLQVSNFHHRQGGTWNSIKVGYYKRVNRRIFLSYATDLLLCGGLLIMAFYHLGIFWIRRVSLSPLLFSLLSITILFRTLTVGDKILTKFFLDLPFYIYVSIDYITFYFGIIFAIHFIENLFPGYLPEVIIKFYYSLGFGFSFFVLLTPVRIFSWTTPFYQVIIIFGMCFSLWILFHAILYKDAHAKTMLIGFLSIFLTVVNDILSTSEYITTPYITPYGVLLFLFVQAFILSAKFSGAFNELEDLKDTLEDNVEVRTRELQFAIEEQKAVLKKLQTTQNQLVQSEKMASLGKLVVSIAHEINTPIGIGITASSSMVEQTRNFANEYQKDNISRGDFEDYLEGIYETGKIILQNLQRTDSLIQSFKNIGVDQVSERKREFYVKKYLQEIVLSFKPAFQNKEIQVSLEGEDVMVNSFPGIFAQIFSNLIHNSLVHGFRNKSNGNIDIDIQMSEANLEFLYQDNGWGIEEEAIEKIYEPFFTSNKQIGTGLGLNIVYNLIYQKLKGNIHCSSNFGSGVVFLIRLPLVEL
ncbi:MAG: sensor histidine kinase [Spirochaetota bacterium]